MHRGYSFTVDMTGYPYIEANKYKITTDDYNDCVDDHSCYHPSAKKATLKTMILMLMIMNVDDVFSPQEPIRQCSRDDS